MSRWRLPLFLVAIALLAPRPTRASCSSARLFLGARAAPPVFMAADLAGRLDHTVEALRVTIDLREQIDWNRSIGLDKLGRRERIDCVPRLAQGITSRSQRTVRRVIRRLQEQGQIDRWQALTIVNRFVARATPAAIRALARLPDVASISGDSRAEGLLEPPPKPDRTEEDAALERARRMGRIGAPEAWRDGIDGTGVLVGIIDSGASREHEQLRHNFRGGASSWFDPVNDAPAPRDVEFGHGTAVLSCAVAANSGRSFVGVAPGARWIAAVGFDSRWYSATGISAAADWMFRVGKPDVLAIPWRIPGEGCDDSLRPLVDAWRAAGMVVVFAAGNSGPAPGSGVSPANYTGLYPGDGIPLSVGAIDGDGSPYEHSSRGPNPCGSEAFPSVVAPGENVLVAFPIGVAGYRLASGTSYATGYVAGAAALLLQRFPLAGADQIETALRQGAVDLGSTGPDETYGHGLINVPRSLQWLQKAPGSARTRPERQEQ